MKQPNVKQIEAIINDLEIKPNYISSYFIECGMYSSKERKVKGKDEFKKEKIVPIADRTFSDILKGKEIKEKSLKALAELFSNLYKKNGKNKIISLSDISIEGEGPLKNNLRIVNNYNELINDRHSIYRIPFFNFLSLSLSNVLYIFVLDIRPGHNPMLLIFGDSHFDIDFINEIIAPFAEA